MTITADMPLVERLRKGANCVGFLDGAPEPAADVADMLRRAAEEIDHLSNEAKKWQVLASQGIQIERELRAEIERLRSLIEA